jgi:hypothetical protein
MGAIRKPRFSDGDVDKAMDGFINRRLALFFSSASDAINQAKGEKQQTAKNAKYSGQPGEHRGHIFIAFQRKRNEQSP